MRTLFLALIVAPSIALAGATKCRDSSGRVFITDGVCPGGARIEKVQQQEYIPEERRIAAQRLRESNNAQARSIDAQRDAELAQNRARLSESFRQADEAQAAKASQDQERRKQEQCVELAKQGRRARHQAMAIGCDWGFEAEAAAQRDRTIREQAQNRPPPVVSRCDNSGCWDTSGNRYNNAGGGNAYRQDGKLCRMVGDRLHCN